MRNIWKIAVATFSTMLLIGVLLDTLFPDMSSIFLVVILAIVAVITILASFFIQSRYENDEMTQRKHL